MPIQSRRRFLTDAAVAGAAGFVGFDTWGKALAAEPPPETTSVRLPRMPIICFAPLYVCEELLRNEGFTDIRFVDISVPELLDSSALSSGRVDFAAALTLGHLIGFDSGAPITLLSGVHVGCYELFAHGDIRTITDLKGKKVGSLGANPLVSMISAWVGLDPKKDLTLVDDPAAKPLELFVEGKLDAYLAFPPEPQQLHARKVGHVILRTAVDRPWSQYFCCTLAGNKEYVAQHPAATKRVIRAILKAADLCASQPEQSARLIVDRGFVAGYDYALQTLDENPYGQWREYDAEDSVRFYALRLHELGMIKRDPKRILAEGTDFHFFDELKRELKA
jgi:NitT/TauT family transport system substrate-binding protein